MNKSLSLYFCTALFCHVVLFSALSNGWKKSIDASAQTNSIASYIVLPSSPLQKDSIAQINLLSHRHSRESWDPGLMHPKQLGMYNLFGNSIIFNIQNIRFAPLDSRFRGNDGPFFDLRNNAFSKGKQESQSTEPLQKINLNQHSTVSKQGRSTLLTLLHNTIEQHQQYPLNAILAHQSGTATVDFILLPDGTLIDTAIQQSSGYSALDQAALEAVQAISPFKEMPLKIKQHFNVAVSFSLR